MKALPKLVLAITAAAALSFVQPARANLITNPGFENGFPGNPWTINNGAAVAPGAGAHSGVFYGWLPSSGGNSPTISQSVATTPSATYSIDFFVAYTATTPTNLTVTFGATVFSYLFTGISGYTHLGFNATASGTNTNLLFRVVSGVGTVSIDDVSVNPAGVGVPDGGTTVSLLGCAFLGLAALRRKLSC
ncbi:MAG TPA: VPDSG-CTERM sorting domain-containing protein [Candidatus Udaeobacter sp.]|nr:VPDSG-CTERM sorting domain-containing protein [Candidatus Udaeobacter sp.]